MRFVLSQCYSRLEGWLGTYSVCDVKFHREGKCEVQMCLCLCLSLCIFDFK